MSGDRSWREAPSDQPPVSPEKRFTSSRSLKRRSMGFLDSAPETRSNGISWSSGLTASIVPGPKPSGPLSSSPNSRQSPRRSRDTGIALSRPAYARGYVGTIQLPYSPRRHPPPGLSGKGPATGAVQAETRSETPFERTFSIILRWFFLRAIHRVLRKSIF